MIAYAVCVADDEKYDGICAPGLARVVSEDDVVIRTASSESIFAAYNDVLDQVRDRADLEALVLLHEDTEIVDATFPEVVRDALRAPDVAVAGAIGARGIRSLAWWEGQCFGRVAETRTVIDFGGGSHDVDTVDGLCMAISPWAVRHLRFDDATYSGFDAYDADFCAQARAAGKRVVTAELPVFHRHNRSGAERAEDDGGSLQRNDAIFRAKWFPRPDGASANADTHGAGVRAGDHGEDGYFEHTRPELRALVPADARRVLDVGCGAGALGAALKAERAELEVVGLEGFPDAAERARARLDGAWCLDLDTLDALPDEAGTFDAMIFGDVLEHLRDPRRLIRALLPSLSPGGVIVCSIPNLRHWTVTFPLLVQDRFTYTDAGLLDRTHVHFFTLEEISAMLDDLGLEGVHVGVNDLAPLPEQLAPLADLASGYGEDRSEAVGRLGAYQYLVVARPATASAASSSQGEDQTTGGAPDAPLRLRDHAPAGAERILDVDAALLADLPVDGGYDAILLDDVLAQIREPEAAVRSLLPLLADDGVLVCSLPNVKHWSVLADLVLHDRFPYDGGLRDPGHVHFFTLEETAALLDATGLTARAVIAADVDPLPDRYGPLLQLAVSYGAEPGETEARLGIRRYVVVAGR